MDDKQIKRILALPFETTDNAKRDGAKNWCFSKDALRSLSKLSEEELVLISKELSGLFDWASNQGRCG